MDQLLVEGVEGIVDLTKLRGVPYRGPRHPGNTSVEEFLATLEQGGNCQLLALGALREGGFYIDDELPMDQGGRFGSKELWLDTEYTELVVSGRLSPARLWDLFTHEHLKAFDIYFFLPLGVCHPEMSSDIDPELAKRLHIAVWLGYDKGWTSISPYRTFLHNANPGPSALWSMQDFINAEYSLYGVKRPTRRIEH